jgi:hypothetical protein
MNIKGSLATLETIYVQAWVVRRYSSVSSRIVAEAICADMSIVRLVALYIMRSVLVIDKLGTFARI